MVSLRFHWGKGSKKCKMNIPLVEGNFSKKDATDIITQLIHIKIKFLESKINSCASEEEIKRHKRKVNQLQKYLFEFKNFIEQQTDELIINSEIQIIKKNGK